MSSGSIPRSRASSATLGNQCASPGLSACVPTNTTSRPASRRAFRQACPVSEYAKTAIRGEATVSGARRQRESGAAGPGNGPRRRDRAETVHVPHGEARAAPHLLVDAADVLADDPEAGHRDAEQREENREEREDSLHLGADDEPPHEQEKAEEDSAESPTTVPRIPKTSRGSVEKPVMRSKLRRMSR